MSDTKQFVTFRVAGTSFRQEALKKLVEVGFKNKIKLVREPDNEYDANAIKIFVISSEDETLFVGYVPKEIAAQVVGCKKGVIKKVTIYGGGDKNYGCAIDIDFYGIEEAIVNSNSIEKAPSEAQLKWIAQIEKKKGIKFEGSTMREASQWITDNK